METKKYTVYSISLNGEVKYVGKTCRYIERKRKHLNQRGTYMSAIPLDADLNKIEFNVVAEFNNEEEALKYEDQLILQYNTLDGGWNKIRSGLIKTSDMKAYKRDYSAAYYQVHKEERAAYRAAHKEERAAYRAAHKEEIAAYNRDYYQAHKEERALYMRDYRARKKPSVIPKAS